MPFFHKNKIDEKIKENRISQNIIFLIISGRQYKLVLSHIIWEKDGFKNKSIEFKISKSNTKYLILEKVFLNNQINILKGRC